MKKYAANNSLVLVLTVALLVTACGSGDKAVSDGELLLSFDGESCILEGPTLLKAGPVTLIFRNESGERAGVNLMRHLGDETIQDMIDSIGEEPSTDHEPPWVYGVGTWRSVAIGETLRWEGDLEPAIHTMICARIRPHGVWFGTGLTVEG